MVLSKTNLFISNLRTVFQEHFANTPSKVIAIYVFGSFARNDFIFGQSDIDIAVFLDITSNENQWEHPDFIEVCSMISDVGTHFTHLFRSESPDIVAFNADELNALRLHGDLECAGAVKHLTFLAFDFLAHHQLLSGDDVLDDVHKIPNPLDYATQRLKWIKNYYQTKVVPEPDLSNLLMSLGSTIQYFAVMDGIRDIRKPVLARWSEEFEGWHGDISAVVEPYYDYIMGRRGMNILQTKMWQEKARKFLGDILGK